MKMLGGIKRSSRVRKTAMSANQNYKGGRSMAKDPPIIKPNQFTNTFNSMKRNMPVSPYQQNNTPLMLPRPKK